MSARKKPAKPAKLPKYDFDDGARGLANVGRDSTIEDISARKNGTGHAPAIITRVRKYKNTTPLDWMLAKGLDHKLWTAGTMFRSAWVTVREGRSITAGYGERQAAGHISLQEVEHFQECRKRVDEIYTLLSPAQAREVIRVCGEDERVGKTNDTLLRGLEVLAAVWVRVRFKDVVK